MRTFLTTILFFYTCALYSQVETRYFDKPAELEEISSGHVQELPIFKAITNPGAPLFRFFHGVVDKTYSQDPSCSYFH